MKNCFIKLVYLIGLSFFPFISFADMRVLTCEPEWAALVKELSGNWVTVNSATSTQEDPHHIQARPSLISKARRADLLVCTGAELEIGWLPLLQSESANSKIQPGADGFFETSRFVTLLEKPTNTSRTEGDVHAAGNPHFQLDPRRILLVAQSLSKKLVQLDPTHENDYRTKLTTFTQKMENTIKQIEESTKELKGKKVLAYHTNYIYLFDWLDLKMVATLEPKPGIEPPISYLDELKNRVKQQQLYGLIYSSFQPNKPIEWMKENTNIKTLALPATFDDQISISEFFIRISQQLLTLK